MPSAAIIARDLIQSLDRVLIPATRTPSQTRLILAGTPTIPAGIEARDIPAALPPESPERQPFPLGWRWDDSGFQVLNVPYLIGIIDGVAEFQIGISGEEQCSEEHRGKSLLMPPGTFLLIPPGVPHRDLPHWPDVPVSSAPVRIFWAHIIPSGTLCHSCSGQGDEHRSQMPVLVEDNCLAPLITTLIDEAGHDSTESRIISHAMLLSFLLRTRRGLSGSAKAAYGLNTWLPIPGSPPPSVSEASALQQSLEYIQAHLSDHLTPGIIASHAGVTAAQLHRLFRRHRGLSIMDYVTQQRMETAMSLLSSTSLSIGEIAQSVGYKQIGHFSRSFSRRNNMTPLQFRRNVNSTALS